MEGIKYSAIENWSCNAKSKWLKDEGGNFLLVQEVGVFAEDLWLTAEDHLILVEASAVGKSRLEQGLLARDCQKELF